MKVCTKCGQTKPKSDFYAKRNRCKACVREDVKQRRISNPEKTKAGKRKHYLKYRNHYRKVSRDWRNNNLERNRESNRKWRQANKAQIRIKDECWRYNISPEDFERISKQQNGRCAICGATSSGKKGLHVDHCHKSGKVRGLLCNKCNTAIGMLKEDVELLKNAIAYLSISTEEVSRA